jgi:hypothetical protein
MGTWGTSIFSDDTAADLREDYRDLIGDGVSGAEATDRLLADWEPDASDAYFSASFWLALALTQWKSGRLEDRVKARALAAIADGSALAPWRGGKDEKRRVAVLDKARAQLLSPQPAAAKIKQRIRCSCDWELTELVAYKLRSGDQVILHVIDFSRDKGGTYPSCDVLDWQGPDVPAADMLQALPVRPVNRETYFGLFKRADPNAPIGPDMSRICILGLREPSPKGRFVRLNVTRNVPYEAGANRALRSGRCVLLKHLDQDLADWFGFH